MKPFLQASWARGLGRVLSFASVLLLGVFGAGLAQADPPGRVGRLADLNGQVWFQAQDSKEWEAAQRNRPLTNGDRISTDANANAELTIGSASLRLDSGTAIDILQIDDEHIDLQLLNGSVYMRVQSQETARELGLNTAEGRFQIERAGRYLLDRIDASSAFSAINGQARFQGGTHSRQVANGQRVEVWLAADGQPSIQSGPLQSDAFANWNRERDRGDEHQPYRPESGRYVSEEMTGAEDLDRHGRWQQSSEFGSVWYPSDVPSGWAPYSTGRWVWVRPWGWTWVDAQPWGFAPFHYGRWVHWQSRWCWVPGRYVRRPVYAPALVAWVGGPRWGVSINLGGAAPIGWFALGPREVYVPGYRVSPHYVQNVNITHVTNITNITNIINPPQQVVGQAEYRNRHIPKAVTVVPQSVLSRQEAVAPAAQHWRDTSPHADAWRGRDRQWVVAAPTVQPAINVPSVAQPGPTRHIPERGQNLPSRSADRPLQPVTPNTLLAPQPEEKPTMRALDNPRDLRGRVDVPQMHRQMPQQSGHSDGVTSHWRGAAPAPTPAVAVAATPKQPSPIAPTQPTARAAPAPAQPSVEAPTRSTVRPPPERVERSDDRRRQQAQ